MQRTLFVTLFLSTLLLVASEPKPKPKPKPQFPGNFHFHLLSLSFLYNLKSFAGFGYGGLFGRPWPMPGNHFQWGNRIRITLGIHICLQMMPTIFLYKFCVQGGSYLKLTLKLKKSNLGRGRRPPFDSFGFEQIMEPVSFGWEQIMEPVDFGMKEQKKKFIS